MIVEVLICKPDGSQSVEPREVPDTFFEAVQADEQEADNTL